MSPLQSTMFGWKMLMFQPLLSKIVKSPHRESLLVVDHYFLQYAIQEQDILGRQESVEKVLSLVPEDILFPMWYMKDCRIELKAKKPLRMLCLSIIYMFEYIFSCTNGNGFLSCWLIF